MSMVEMGIVGSEVSRRLQIDDLEIKWVLLDKRIEIQPSLRFICELFQFGLLLPRCPNVHCACIKYAVINLAYLAYPKPSGMLGTGDLSPKFVL